MTALSVWVKLPSMTYTAPPRPAWQPVMVLPPPRVKLLPLSTQTAPPRYAARLLVMVVSVIVTLALLRSSSAPPSVAVPLMVPPSAGLLLMILTLLSMVRAGLPPMPVMVWPARSSVTLVSWLIWVLELVFVSSWTVSFWLGSSASMARAASIASCRLS